MLSNQVLTRSGNASHSLLRGKAFSLLGRQAVKTAAAAASGTFDCYNYGPTTNNAFPLASTKFRWYASTAKAMNPSTVLPSSKKNPSSAGDESPSNKQQAQKATKSSLAYNNDYSREDGAPSPLPFVENPLPDFSDVESAYQGKTSKELVRGLGSFSLCRITPLVKRAEPLLHWTRRLLGDRITDGVLKATLFGHFCAGEDGERIKPEISKLQEAGIGSILDYAAEDDGGGVPSIKDRVTDEATGEPVVAQTYDYENEAKCDRHVETFVKCIQDVADLQADGFAAVKVTALGNPALLKRMSKAVTEAQNLFAKFDLDGDGFISEEEFERGFNTYFREDYDFKHVIEEKLSTLSDYKPGYVDYITWSHLLSPCDLPKITVGCREHGPLSIATPTAEEVALIEKLYERGHILAREAAARGVRLLVDAEQSWFQPAIDNLVLDLQRTYNAVDETDHPVIYNTYQCYLKDAPGRLRTDVARSQRSRYHFGAKLVRGAYMESERALAEELGVPSPIHGSPQETHDCYNAQVRYLLERSSDDSSETKVELMCATHNQESIELAIKAMNEFRIDRKSSTISFAQLYGMMDHVTFNLGLSGFRAYKYVPYGEVKMALAYLIRRANENNAVAGGAGRELRILFKELSRRVFKIVSLGRLK